MSPDVHEKLNDLDDYIVGQLQKVFKRAGLINKSLPGGEIDVAVVQSMLLRSLAFTVVSSVTDERLLNGNKHELQQFVSSTISKWISQFWDYRLKELVNNNEQKH